MIDSSVSSVSGFNANAYLMTVARAKRETVDESAPKNGLRAEDYWTPERMREAVPPDMGRAVPGSDVKPHIPEQSELPQETKPGFVSGNLPQLGEYWTPERMREAVPPDMGRAVPEPDVKPHIPEQSELPQETKPGFVSGNVPQLGEYWTPERMREAVPPDMGRAVPEPDVKPHIPEQSELPQETKPGFVSGNVPQLGEYWTPERMREAVPPDMGRAVPEPDVKPHIPEQSELPQETKPGFVSGNVPQLGEYWTPERMREAVPPDMGRAVPGSDAEPHIPEQSESPQETHLPTDAKGFSSGGKSGSLPQPNPKPINTMV